MGKGSPYRFEENRFTTMHYRFYAYNRYKQSPKDLYPKWKQDIQVDYQHTPFTEETNDQFSVQTHLCFPGFVRHQSLVLYGGYSQNHIDNYKFSLLIAIPRGYSDLQAEKMEVLKADYAFPIAYPDMDWQGVMYLKRIYAHAFYDFMRAENTGSYENYASTGMELYTDWNFFSWFPNVSIGLRWSYALNREAQTVDFLFGINF
jgi:hypothetical protein